MQLPITIGLHRSRLPALLIAFAALAATGVTAFYPGNLWLRIALLLFILITSAVGLLGKLNAFSRLRLCDDGRIEAACPGELDFQQLTFNDAASVHPFLTVLRLKDEIGVSRTIVLTPWHLAADDFRKLRVFLRWRADFSEPDDA